MEILMRRLILLFAVAAMGQEYPDLAAWMKTNNTASSALRKLEKKTGPQAVRPAEQMGGVFENMIAFWRGRNISDAVKWAESGKASALELATAASAGDAERAEAAFKTLTDTCRQCHEAHREKIGEGKYRLK
jgi:cytochrome c556